jgi:hypothetical protein
MIQAEGLLWKLKNFLNSDYTEIDENAADAADLSEEAYAEYERQYNVTKQITNAPTRKKYSKRLAKLIAANEKESNDLLQGIRTTVTRVTNYPLKVLLLRQYITRFNIDVHESNMSEMDTNTWTQANGWLQSHGLDYKDVEPDSRAFQAAKNNVPVEDIDYGFLDYIYEKLEQNWGILEQYNPLRKK